MSHATHVDAHAAVYEAKAGLSALRGLVGEARGELIQASGFGVACLIRLIEDQLSEALEDMGGDPDRIDLPARPENPPADSPE